MKISHLQSSSKADLYEVGYCNAFVNIVCVFKRLGDTVVKKKKNTFINPLLSVQFQICSEVGFKPHTMCIGYTVAYKTWIYRLDLKGALVLGIFINFTFKIIKGSRPKQNKSINIFFIL